MSNLQDPQFWEILLGKLLQPDTAVINQATAELNSLLENPGSVVCIFERLSNSENIGVRHQAALLVRNKLRKFWEGYDQSIKDGMKDTLANIIMNPATVRPIRNSTTDIISLIARLSVPTGEWPTYFPWVISLIQNADRPDMRETGIYMLQNIMESGVLPMIEEYITKNYQDVRAVLISGLQDANEDVRIRSMNCVVSFMEALDIQDETNTLHLLIPPLIGAIKRCVEENDERVAAGFEVLDFVAEHHLSQIGGMLGDLLVFVLTVGANVDLAISIRQKALMFLEFVINLKPKTFASANLLEPSIQLAFQLMTEEEDDISGEDTASKYGSQLLDSMALVIPAHMMWRPTLARLQAFLTHEDAEHRKAAINALAILSEGCNEQVEEIFDEVMPFVLNGFNQENAVRQASCIALAEFSKHLPDSLAPYGEQLVPVLVRGIHDPIDLVRVKSCYALAECSSTEHLKPHFMPHIEPLLTRLVEMLTDKNVEVQELSVNALSALVDMADEHIEPYFSPIIDVMKRWMIITNPEQISVRARATECVATLASARKELFVPHFEECIRIVVTGFQLNSPEMREYIYGYCEHMTRLFTDQMAPYMDDLIPFIFATLESVEEFASLGTQEDFCLADEAARELDVVKLGAMVDEKDAAISLIGWLAFNYCQRFERFVDKTLEYLLPLTAMVFSPSTCSAATVALVQLSSCVQSIVDPEYGWVAGQPASLNPRVEEFLGQVLEAMLANLDDEEENVVINTYEAFGNLLLAFGPCLPDEVLNEVTGQMHAVMSRQSTCQLAREAFDDSENDITLYLAVMELLSKFTQVYSESFIPTMESFLMATRPYFEPQVSADFKNVTIATVAELAQHLKGLFKPYCASFLPIAMDLLANRPDKTIKHNSCYCAGLLIQHGAETVAQHYPEMCRILGEVTKLNPAKFDTVLDNAAGTLARMILTRPDLMPLEQVVPAMRQLLPLRSDMEPALSVHEAYFALREAGHPVVLAEEKIWVNVFVVELLTSELPKEALREQLLAYVKTQYHSNQQEIDGLLQNCVNQGNAPAETAERFHAVLNSQ